jgi:hypothetical protein
MPRMAENNDDDDIHNHIHNHSHNHRSIGRSEDDASNGTKAEGGSIASAPTDDDGLRLHSFFSDLYDDDTRRKRRHE